MWDARYVLAIRCILYKGVNMSCIEVAERHVIVLYAAACRRTLV